MTVTAELGVLEYFLPTIAELQLGYPETRIHPTRREISRLATQEWAFGASGSTFTFTDGKWHASLDRQERYCNEANMNRLCLARHK